MDKQILIDGLNKVKEQALNRCIEKYNNGVCYNWYNQVESEFTYDLVSRFCKDWESFSGDMNCPIDGDENSGLWYGNNLRLRLSLINHILNHLENVDQEYLDDLYLSCGYKLNVYNDTYDGE